MRTVKLTLEYDGTDFVGWQRQAERRTVQGEVERALGRLAQREAAVVGAGRTDSGVHALGQVAHWQTDSGLPADRIQGGLNALLPPDVRVLAVEDVPGTFHARYDARVRLYRYVILNRRAPSALWRRQAYHVPDLVDLDRVREALDVFRGRHDFRAFRGLGTPTRTTFCSMFHTGLRRDGDLVVLTFAADRFLKHMVRMIVGTLLRVGRGAIGADEVERMLDGGADASGGPTAPPHGLYLVWVGYGEVSR